MEAHQASWLRMGQQVPDSVAARQPFCEWEVVIGLIAQCVASSRAVMGVL